MNMGRLLRSAFRTIQLGPNLKHGTTIGSLQDQLVQAQLQSRLISAVVQSSNIFRGHGMLAPFTAGWQTTDSDPLVIEKSEGCYVYDVHGNRYLDALAGLWSTALGGSEPQLVAAATTQLNKLPFYHSFWNRTTKPSLDLAEELLETFSARKMSKAFFVDSGSEANDTQIAAFIAEPVMGAGGVIPPPATYFDKIQAAVKKYDILFIADEIVCAFGRLGEMFGSDKYNIKPDLALSAAYMPIGAVLVSPEISEVIYSQSNKLGVGAYFGAQCQKHGMLVRVAGDTIMMCPHLIISEEELDELTGIYGKALKATEERVKELKSEQT
ncbi:hypothetical protein Ancab_026867 [Ancistrocladus abbreviatus]